MLKHSRLKRFILIALVAALIGLLTTIAIIDGYGLVDRAQPADVIVVLGSQVYPGGQPGPSLIRRADHALALYRADYADYIICTGGFTEPDPHSEAQVACDLLAAAGVPREALILEERAHSTEENAAYTAAIMRARGWRSAIIATDGYHLLRATWMFQRAGIEAYPSPAQATAGPMNPVERIVREVRETAGLAWFGLRVVLGIDLTRET
ncbi:MAG TPA: YdcF family protein [Anaerolineae bacterium]|nr:YdcF family protein [Anaerolineae bacterium]